MDSYKNFTPINEVERAWIERYNSISRSISATIRSLSPEKRLPYLRASQPNDLSLKNLYLQALEKEDYETCAAAMALLGERGIETLKEK